MTSKFDAYGDDSSVDSRTPGAVSNVPSTGPSKFDAYGDNSATEEEAPTPAPTGIDWADVGKGIVGRGASGLTAIPGMLGDARELVRRGFEFAGDKLGLPSPPEELRQANERMGPPTSSEIQQAVEKLTGAFYEPKTPAGKYAGTIAQFAPAALVPGAGMRRLVPSASMRSVPQMAAARTVNTVAPAVASETAGQLTENTPFEPYARAIGGLTGGLVAGKAISPQAVLPELSPGARAVVGAGAAGLAHTLGAGPLTTMISAAAPYAAERIMRTAPAQRYLSNQALPQSARDIITQELVQQQLSQPSGIERNQAARADAAKRFQDELRARGIN